jgi:hypothetical protein
LGASKFRKYIISLLINIGLKCFSLYHTNKPQKLQQTSAQTFCGFARAKLFSSGVSSSSPSSGEKICGFALEDWHPFEI